MTFSLLSTLTCSVAALVSSCALKITEVPARPSVAFEHPALRQVDPARLKATVEALSYSRPYPVFRGKNEKARDWLCHEFRRLGYAVELQGQSQNVIATSEAGGKPSVLLAAHYDTVPGSPGADDNASGIAVCLEAARVLGRSKIPVSIAVFNREEEGLIGSTQYVASLTKADRQNLKQVHVFEMVGYYTKAPRSQDKPEGLPIRLRDTGDFIGIVSNLNSERLASQIIETTKAVGSRTHLTSLKIRYGFENWQGLGDVLRSDHTSFWKAGMTAVMWTDTSNFRNPHYHGPGDRPETLDYEAMADVTRIAVGQVVRSQSRK